jgi:alpha-tubulin suppressor-like RCC1 family protein
MKTFFTQTPLVRVFFATAISLLSLAGTRVDAQCTYFSKIFTGNSSTSTLGIKNDGTLWAWGSNQSGQLGDGTTNNVSVPEQIGTATNWMEITSGNQSSYGITSDGKLWAWGYNSAGQLGDGTANNSLVPEHIGTGSNWAAVAAGESDCFAIRADGTLWGWGYGILGTNSGPSNLPEQVGSDNDWATVSAGNYHTVALKKNGTLWAWGIDGGGELGDGNPSGTTETSPEQIGTATNWVKISAGYDHVLAITSDGKLWAWGANYYGAVGDGTTTDATNGPEQIGTATNWVDIAGGYYQSAGITADGKLWGWGQNNLGELGNGTVNQSLVPVQAGTATNWTRVFGGLEFNVGMTSDGGAWGWGRNIEGEIGDGTIVNKVNPTNSGPAPVFSGLAATGASTRDQTSLCYFYLDCADLIARVDQNGATPVAGPVTAKVWVDGSVQSDGNGKPYLQRHYEITPATNASSSTGTVTLYFNQDEFTAYNAFAAVAGGSYPMLPVDEADAQGYKNNLNFTKISGTSSDGSGSFASYSGIKELITPSTVVYANGRWQASFPVTSFSGFFGTTGSSTLPLTWLTVGAVLNAHGEAQVDWSVEEQNVASYTVEQSSDGVKFVAVATVAGQGDGRHQYEYIASTVLVGSASYRISQTDKDGRSSYSSVMLLNAASGVSVLSLFPNPASDHVFVNGLSGTGTYRAILTDLSGKTILEQEISTSQNEVYVGSVAGGVYLIRIVGGGSTTALKFLKK